MCIILTVQSARVDDGVVENVVVSAADDPQPVGTNRGRWRLLVGRLGGIAVSAVDARSHLARTT